MSAKWEVNFVVHLLKPKIAYSPEQSRAFLQTVKQQVTNTPCANCGPVKAIKLPYHFSSLFLRLAESGKKINM